MFRVDSSLDLRHYGMFRSSKTQGRLHDGGSYPDPELSLFLDFYIGCKPALKFYAAGMKLLCICKGRVPQEGCLI